ncbi:ABC-2 type transport system permease protein [Rhizobium tibeticum]|nr:ABC-2 type transport system permease protein [Rhizobium tibeticum]
MILTRFDRLGGWTWPEIAMQLGFHLLAYSLGASFSFVQMRNLEDVIRLGTFDTLLLKPVGPWAYLVFSGLNIGYGGHVILGFGFIIWSYVQIGLSAGPAMIVFLVAATISSAALVAAIMTTIGACALLWGRSRYLYSIFFGFWQLARYPLNIFSQPLQAIMLTVMPLAFLSYVPVATMLGKDVPILGTAAGPLTLAAGPIAVLAAVLHWRHCINQYQGGGG